MSGTASDAIPETSGSINPNDTMANLGGSENYEGFTSCMTHLDVDGEKILVRLLRMNGSIMLFIFENNSEYIEEIGLGMQKGKNKCCSATLLSQDTLCRSQMLSEKYSKLYGQQFFVSCNVKFSLVDGLMVERRIAEWLSELEKNGTFRRRDLRTNKSIAKSGM